MIWHSQHLCRIFRTECYHLQEPANVLWQNNSCPCSCQCNRQLYWTTKPKLPSKQPNLSMPTQVCYPIFQRSLSHWSWHLPHRGATWQPSFPHDLNWCVICPHHGNQRHCAHENFWVTSTHCWTWVKCWFVQHFGWVSGQETICKWVAHWGPLCTYHACIQKDPRCQFSPLNHGTH